MKYQYVAIIKKDDDGYNVSFPDFPDAFTYGENLEEALFNAQECLSLVLEDLLAEDKEPPLGSDCSDKDHYLITPDLDIQIALQIYVLKKEKGYTTADLARSMNTSWASFNRIEKPGSNPTVKQLNKVAAALGRRVQITFL